MTAINLTSYGTYRVRFRSKDGKQLQKSFKTKADAKRFAAMLELSPVEKSKRITVGQLLEQYRDTVTVTKASAKTETDRINAFMRRPFAQISLDKIKTADIDAYFDSRRSEISDGSIIRESVTLSAVFNYGKKLGLLKVNPVIGFKKPKEPDARDRVATDEEIEALKICASWDGESVPETDTALVMAAFLFSCKTGMRAGEIMKLEESMIDGRVIRLPYEIIKTRSKREIALSKDALKILNLVRQREDAELLFGAVSEGNRDKLFRDIRNRAGLGEVKDSRGHVIKEGLRFHDGRATFCTWAASINPSTGAPRLPIQTLAKQTGHKNLKILMRYYRPTTEQIADYLDAD